MLTIASQAWKAEHNRVYPNAAEALKREKIWNANMDFIEKHDAAAKGFTVGMNQFGASAGVIIARTTFANLLPLT